MIIPKVTDSLIAIPKNDIHLDIEKYDDTSYGDTD
jgi:hypothetical protein